MNDFQRAVSAMTYSVVRERFPLECSSRNRVARFVVEQHGRMSSHFRLALLILTLAFDLSSLLTRGARFCSLPHATRWKQVEAWKSSRLGPCRDLIRFYESLAVFGCYAMEYPSASPSARKPEVEHARVA